MKPGAERDGRSNMGDGASQLVLHGSPLALITSTFAHLPISTNQSGKAEHRLG